MKEIDYLKQENEKIQLASLSQRQESNGKQEKTDTKQQYDTNAEINNSNLKSHRRFQKTTQN